MRTIRATLAGAVLATALGLAAAGFAGQLPPGSGGVVIDGKLLPAERIWGEYRYQNALRSMIHRQDVNAVDARLFSGVVGQSVDAELLVREAARRGVTTTDEDRAAVRERLVEEWRGESGLGTALAMLGVEESFLVARALDNLLVRRMAEVAVASGEGFDEEGVQDYYRVHPERYQAPHEIRYIFVPSGERDLKDTYRGILADVEAARRDGVNFVGVVAKWSIHASSASGGGVAERLGPGDPGLPFQPTRDRLKDCRITRMQVDAAGLHVYLRDCMNTLPLAVVREKIVTDLLAERRRQWVAGQLARLRDAAKIEHLSAEEPPPAMRIEPHGTPPKEDHPVPPEPL